MKSGFLPKDKAPDDIIAGSSRDATTAGELPEDEAEEGGAEGEPAMAETR